jgi:hypothetical protein
VPKFGGETSAIAEVKEHVPPT